jgi:hypothetical protein
MLALGSAILLFSYGYLLWREASFSAHGDIIVVHEGASTKFFPVTGRGNAFLSGHEQVLAFDGAGYLQQEAQKAGLTLVEGPEHLKNK